MATYSTILAGEIPWTEGPGRLQSMGSQRVEHNWVTEHAHTHTHMNKACYFIEIFCSSPLSFFPILPFPSPLIQWAPLLSLSYQ